MTWSRNRHQDIKTLHFKAQNITTMERQKARSQHWSVALRTYYRQILSVLYSSFPFGNFRPRLVRALLVYRFMQFGVRMDDFGYARCIDRRSNCTLKTCQNKNNLKNVHILNRKYHNTFAWKTKHFHMLSDHGCSCTIAAAILGPHKTPSDALIELHCLVWNLRGQPNEASLLQNAVIAVETTNPFNWLQCHHQKHLPCLVSSWDKEQVSCAWPTRHGHV